MTLHEFCKLWGLVIVTACSIISTGMLVYNQMCRIQERRYRLKKEVENGKK